MNLILCDNCGKRNVGARDIVNHAGVRVTSGRTRTSTLSPGAADIDEKQVYVTVIISAYVIHLKCINRTSNLCRLIYREIY